MLVIKVLGAGCENCTRMAGIAREAATGLGLEATLALVTDFHEMARYRIIGTPALVINEKVVCAGRIPTSAEVTSWITNALS